MASTASGNKELQFPQSAYYYNNNKQDDSKSTSLSAADYYYKEFPMLLDIEDAYVRHLGGHMTPSMRSQAVRLMEDGIQANMIIAVIEYTAVTAPRPSWAYVRTVINKQRMTTVRCDDGEYRFVTSAELFRRSCDNYRKERERLDPWKQEEWRRKYDAWEASR